MSNKIYVWDPLVRFFHWTLVLAFTVAYITGDEENSLHVYSGYYILGLIPIRVIWGIIGTRYARFSNFIYSPSAVVDYLKGFVFMGSGKKYIGHNPAGSWMVFAMLISLLLTGLSGLKVYGLEGYGPLAQSPAIQPQHKQTMVYKVSSSERDDDNYEEHHDDDDREEDNDEEELWEEIHEFFANFTLFLVFLHIGGVLASSIKQQQNLAKSMWTGYKNKTSQDEN